MFPFLPQTPFQYAAILPKSDSPSQTSEKKCHIVEKPFRKVIHICFLFLPQTPFQYVRILPKSNSPSCKD
jgi:hypothetical protein